MTDEERSAAADVDLFDEDVDVGEEAPEDEDFGADELDAIRESQADPETDDPEAEVS
ncbi:hypothetical protein [Phytohabitans kaempferiae]|uniref:Uncharacterized protein n=1 Tax=Phytohabitans kaempferiae TaxID=1620943 RepID=A0ABV6MCI6_9ACTN